MGHVAGKLQVRKGERLWEVWTFTGISWIRIHQSMFWYRCMLLATGQTPYGEEARGWHRQVNLAWHG